MSHSREHLVIPRYQNMKLAVVEVRVGETREDAWRRYLAEHPQGVAIDVKIFHYPNPKRANHDGEKLIQ